MNNMVETLETKKKQLSLIDGSARHPGQSCQDLFYLCEDRSTLSDGKFMMNTTCKEIIFNLI